MYTTTTATRQQSLVAAAAAMRAMERHACCKSQFKFKCFACGEMINRGDKITHCNRQPTGMTLRYRGADCQTGLTMAETAFYQCTTGKDMWVHIGCIPCYWDSLPPTSNEYSRPKLRPICTDWGVKVYGEFEEWCGSEDCDTEVLPHFRLMKGYPKEKLMFDRIIHAVKRFQAIWRGYIYKRAYPEALRAAKATQTINLNARATLSTKRRNCQSAEEYGSVFYSHNKSRVGSNCAILFDRGRKNETIYSCEIVSISGEANGVYVYVRFHHDEERKSITGKNSNISKWNAAIL